MNAWDIALLLLLALAVFFALRRVIRTRRKGGCSCGGSCDSCSCGCKEKKP